MKRHSSIPCPAAVALLPKRLDGRRPGMVGRVCLSAPLGDLRTSRRAGKASAEIASDRDNFAGRRAGGRIGAQISNLLGRRLPAGISCELPSAGGLEIRDTAGWKPALLRLRWRRAGTDAPCLREFSPRRIRAFSVLELMVAVSLLALIVVALLAMFNQTQKAFRGGMAQTDVMESGRIAMQFLTREMQQIAPMREPGAVNLMIWTPTTLAPWNLPQRPLTTSTMDLPSNQARDNHLQDITFVTRLSDEWVATAYRISNAVDGAGALYRWTQTYTNGVSSGTLSNFCWWATSVPAPDSTIPSTYNTNFQFIADGIVHLAAYPFSTNGVAMTNGMLIANGLRGYAYLENEVPAFLDLELGVLELKTVAQFNARAPGARVAWLTDQANRMHLFIQRIPIRNAP